MTVSNERELHKAAGKYHGTYILPTHWGGIEVRLTAVPNYAGGEGCPDEIVKIDLKMLILGATIKAAVPVLVELEKAGYPAAKRDLDVYCTRSLSGEQPSYVEIPFLVVGGDNARLLDPASKAVNVRFSCAQVPMRLIRTC